jgi:hypothetical protein
MTRSTCGIDARLRQPRAQTDRWYYAQRAVIRQPRALALGARSKNSDLAPTERNEMIGKVQSYYSCHPRLAPSMRHPPAFNLVAHVKPTSVFQVPLHF